MGFLGRLFGRKKGPGQTKPAGEPHQPTVKRPAEPGQRKRLSGFEQLQAEKAAREGEILRKGDARETLSSGERAIYFQIKREAEIRSFTDSVKKMDSGQLSKLLNDLETQKSRASGQREIDLLEQKIYIASQKMRGNL